MVNSPSQSLQHIQSELPETSSFWLVVTMAEKHEVANENDKKIWSIAPRVSL